MDDQIDLDFFEDALKEEGLTDFEASKKNNISGATIRVVKRIGGERVEFKTDFTYREFPNSPDIEKLLTMAARDTARAFDEKLTEVRTFGDSIIEFDVKEDYSARCVHCNEEVTMKEIVETPASPFAEATSPVMYGNYRSIQKEKLKFTLLSFLKTKCRPECPNSPIDLYR